VLFRSPTGCPRHGMCAWVLGLSFWTAAARRRFSALSLNCHPDRVPQARSVCLGLGSLLLDCGGSPPLFRPKPELSSRPERPDCFFRAAFWRVGPRSGGIAAPLARAHLRRAHRAPLPHTPLMLFSV